MQQGYMMRTPRGRVATTTAYQHFGLQSLKKDGPDSAQQQLT
ncbi:MAG: hypothetical protein OIF34_08610 [Porticoccaceae bacterium]|nr:hypothetical protein [Porticoccaceae bacterium]